MEACMLDIMYQLPSLKNVKECVITEEVVLKKADPLVGYHPVKKQA
jgi:ATP-dependent Clp protease ATP-binding subunit ClpX